MPDVERRRNTIKIMMYIFPRQFGLHNVFTSRVESSKTAQKFQDYTLREEEISSAFPVPANGQPLRLPKIPKRLRNDAERLVRKLQVLHGRCSYIELLRHYCPCWSDNQHRTRKTRRKGPISTQWNGRSQSDSKGASQARQYSKKHVRKQHAPTQLLPAPKYTSLVDLATPASQVSAFCQAVLSKIIPDGFWGDGEVQLANKKTIMSKVDHFIRLRRFETMSMHEVSQDLKVMDSEIPQLNFLTDNF